MTLDEAIERITKVQMEFLPLPRHRDWEAVQLGIEALKWLNGWRGVNSALANVRLPGQTEK